MKQEHKEFLAKYDSAEHIDSLINGENLKVRNSVANNPNANKEHLDKLVNDEHWKVRASVASSPSATKEHLFKLLNDESYYVSSMAQEVMKDK